MIGHVALCISLLQCLVSLQIHNMYCYDGITKLCTVIVGEIGRIHVDFKVRNDNNGARMSCGCCGGANYKDMEFPDYNVLADYASAMNAFLVHEEITPTPVDKLFFCSERPPALREAIEIAERTMNVRRKSLVRRNKAKRTISLTAPAQFRGNFLMLISRLPYFEATFSIDSVFRSKYTSMLQELVSAIEDDIVPYREEVATPVLGEFPEDSPDEAFDFSQASSDSNFLMELRGEDIFPMDNLDESHVDFDGNYFDSECYEEVMNQAVYGDSFAMDLEEWYCPEDQWKSSMEPAEIPC